MQSCSVSCLSMLSVGFNMVDVVAVLARHEFASLTTPVEQSLGIEQQPAFRFPAVQTAVDPQGYGISALAPAPLPRSSFSTASDLGSEASFGTDSAFETEGQLQRAASTSSLQRSPSIRRLGMMMLASGVALAIARTGSGSNLGDPAEDERAVAARAGLRSRSSKHGSSGSKKHHQQHQQKAHHHRRQRHSEVAALAAVPE